MITLKQLSLKNFLSHSDTEIDFKDNQKLLIDGRSGSGKSSLLDSLIWCLYGKSRASNTALIKSGEKSATVSVILTSEDIFYKITRKITEAGKHTIALDESNDGEEYLPSKVAGIKEIQNFITQDILHASYTLFVNSVASPQDSVESFIDQPASSRKQLLLEIAGSEKYDLYYERAKSKVSLEREAISRLTGKLEDKQRFIPLLNSLPAEVELLKKDSMEKSLTLSMREAEQSELSKKLVEVNSIQKRLNDLRSQRVQISTNFDGTNREIARLLTSIEVYKKLDPTPIKEKVDEYEALGRNYEALEASQSLVRAYDVQLSQIISLKPPEVDYTSEIASLRERIEALDKMEGTKCLQCGAPIPSMEATLKSQKSVLEGMLEARKTAQMTSETARSEYVKKIEALGTRPESKETELQDTKQKMLILQPFLKQYQEALNAATVIMELEKSMEEQKKKFEEFTVNLVEMDSKIKVVEDELGVIGDVSLITTTIERFKIEILGLKNEAEGIKSAIAEKEAMLKIAMDAKGEIETIESEMKTRNEDLTALESIKDAFGSKGIKTLIIDQFVPMLEKRINDVLEQLSDFRVEIDTQRESADGESTVEGLYINVVSPNGVTREFSLYSGGEKLKVRIAISEALASLNRVSFRLYDEAFFALDSDSLTGFATVLEQIQSKFSQILVISHLQEIKDMFNEKIEVVNRNGDSEII